MASTTLADDSSPNSHIENLPCLIRHNVMVRLDLADFNALARASPILYQQVKRDRRSILYRQLKTMLGNTLLDAYAAYQTSSPPFTNGRRDNAVVQPFLESYANKLLTQKAGPSLGDLNDEAIIAMWTFQTTIVAPLVDVFAQWTLRNLSNFVENQDQDAWGPPDGDGPDAGSLQISLSATERMRILRGMYRFQLYCHVFGSQGRSRPRFESEPFVSKEDVIELFCRIFEPWEFEEFACIQKFAQDKWNSICYTFGREIGETSPLFDEVTPPGGKQLRNPSVTFHVVDGTASRGLQPLHAISFVGGDHTKRIEVMHKVLAWPVIEYLNFLWTYMDHQWWNRRNRPSERDWKEVRHEPLPFSGDGESDQFRLRPPVAWVMLWKGRYSNIRFFDSKLLEWGYVIWDKDRIDSTGAEKITFCQNFEDLPLGNLDHYSTDEEEDDDDDGLTDFDFSDSENE